MNKVGDYISFHFSSSELFGQIIAIKEDTYIVKLVKASHPWNVDDIFRIEENSYHNPININHLYNQYKTAESVNKKKWY
jgi:hypothetical protein